MSKDTMPDNLMQFRKAFSKNAEEFDALVVAMFEHVETAKQKQLQEAVEYVLSKGFATGHAVMQIRY